MMNKLQKLATDDAADSDDESDEEGRRKRPSSIENDASIRINQNPIRWEKACMLLPGIVNQVSKVDPDGLDIVCFGGDSKPNIYRNVRNQKDCERLVTAKAPSGPCYLGEAMELILKETFERGFKKRPCGILVLTAGAPDDSKRLEKTLRDASNRIATEKWKESPLTITFIHIGGDLDAEEYMRYLDSSMTSEMKNRKTGEKENICDTVKDTDIKAAMKEIKGTSSSGKSGAIIGAFAGAAMGMGGLYMYNKNQVKKKTNGWNGKWKATFDGMEVAELSVNDDMKGSLIIDGFPAGRTTGKYSEKRQGYLITFRDADENWVIRGTIEDEHTIYWGDGTKWAEIQPKQMKTKHYVGAAAAGAATGGAVGYLLDKKFFKKAHKKDQADYVIVVDRSAMMAITDKADSVSASGKALGYGYDDDDADDGTLLGSMTKKMNQMDTGDKVAAGILGTAAVAGTVGLGVAGVHAVKDHKEQKTMNEVHAINHARIKKGYDGSNMTKNAVGGVGPIISGSSIQGGGAHNLGSSLGGGGGTHGSPTARNLGSSMGGGGTPASLYTARVGLNGRYRATFDGDEVASLNVHDDLEGHLTIKGYMGGTTVGRYQTDHIQRISEIHFMDADEQWPVKGDVKGNGMATKTNIIMWADGTRWDRVG